MANFFFHKNGSKVGQEFELRSVRGDKRGEKRKSREMREILVSERKKEVERARRYGGGERRDRTNTVGTDAERKIQSLSFERAV